MHKFDIQPSYNVAVIVADPSVMIIRHRAELGLLETVFFQAHQVQRAFTAAYYEYDQIYIFKLARHCLTSKNIDRKICV